MPRRKTGFIQAKLDRKSINFMINLRLNGWSYASLASFFGVDKKAVKYQCMKYGIFFDGFSLSIPPLVDGRKKKESRQWQYIDGEKINMGKSYAEYLKDASKRSPS